MIKRMLRRWLGIATDNQLTDTYEEEVKRAHYIGGSLSETAAAISAYKISNGFIVRTIDKSVINRSMQLPQFTFCKDQKEIADFIIAESARHALGVGQQYEMFDKTGSVIANSVAAQRRATI